MKHNIVSGLFTLTLLLHKVQTHIRRNIFERRSIIYFAYFIMFDRYTHNREPCLYDIKHEGYLTNTIYENTQAWLT